MTASSQTTFSNAFSWMKKICISIQISLMFILRIQLTINQLSAPSHCLNQWRSSSPTHICVIMWVWIYGHQIQNALNRHYRSGLYLQGYLMCFNPQKSNNKHEAEPLVQLSNTSLEWFIIKYDNAICAGYIDKPPLKSWQSGGICNRKTNETRFAIPNLIGEKVF